MFTVYLSVCICIWRQYNDVCVYVYTISVYSIDIHRYSLYFFVYLVIVRIYVYSRVVICYYLYIRMYWIFFPFCWMTYLPLYSTPHNLEYRITGGVLRGEDGVECRVEAGGRPRTGWGRIVTLDSVSEWRRTGERGAAATGGYIHPLYLQTTV